MKKPILSLLIAVGLIGSASATVIPTPVAEWKLDGNANDSVGSADGNAAGVTYVDSIINGYHTTVANFDGTGGIIFNNNLSNLKVGSSFTVSAWVNVNNWGASGGNNDFTVFAMGNPTHWPDNPHQAALYVGFSQNNSDFSLYGKDDYPVNSEGTASRASTTIIPYNSWNDRYLAITSATWNLLTWTYDGSQINSYLNGTLLYQNGSWANASNISPYSNFSNAYIGIDNGVSPQGPIFNGLMSDVQIYNTALSSSDVQQLYAAPEPSTYALFGLGAIGMLMVMRRKTAA
jgi:Concanavalin A-like lectin/glucanases superfamily/PEP-CTERM motif